METFATIMSRRSIRKFKEQEVSDEEIHKILEAGMAGPSCVNARDWSFLVVKNKDTLTKMADANGKPAEPLRKAAFGILVCGDIKRAFPPSQEYWVIDGSIAIQNMILTAHSMGIGSVWLGTWPQMERVEAQRKLFDLPETQIPHSLIAFGYPAEDTEEIDADKSKYEADRVHFEQW